MRHAQLAQGLPLVLLSMFLLFASVLPFVHAAPPSQASGNPSGNVSVLITTSTQLISTAGQFVAVRANITNLSSNQSVSGIAYISIVDLANNVPIDLEDWSAQKGIYIDSIPPGRTVTSEWSIRLVTSGSYTVDVLFGRSGDLVPPASSQRISLEVAPRVNLNPGNVLPVAFGVPALLIGVLGLINYRRGKKMGVYG
jgi:hypothetical protein